MHPKIRRGEINPCKTLGTLVMDFFELYGCSFNYQNTGISIRDGGAYFSKMRRGWADARKADLLSIEDPHDSCTSYILLLRLLLSAFDIANDISRGSFSIQDIRRTFESAFYTMRAAASLRTDNLSARKSENYVNLNGPGASALFTEMSILSTVLGIDQKVCSHHELRDRYDDVI